MTSTHSALSHPKYRPDVDGLRAVAVLSVVAFHAFPESVTGGFIGVDVFFVISGFLISTIIFENLEKNSFSFSTFYARRIKRIFPALLLVMAACLAFGWVSLLADEYMQLGKHTAAGAGFLSNFILWGEAGYFDNAAETKPLLHLWSLGIEEQFYIIWPLLLWLAWKRKFNLVTIGIVLCVISFYLNMKGIRKEPSATFYSPQTRFWELLCGSLLAWVSIYRRDAYTGITSKLDGWLGKAIYKDPPVADGRTLVNVLSFIGLILLLFGFLHINKGLRFPGAWAIVPVLGAVFIIVSGPTAWVNKNILSTRVAVWFGLISFPLYLWHWPLLSFARIMGSGSVDNRDRFVAVIVSIALAWLTYIFIEKNIRYGGYTKAKVAVLVVLMGVIGGIGYDTFSKGGLAYREVVKINSKLETGLDGGDGNNSIEDCGIQDEATRKRFEMCARDKRGNVKYALMGDSKAKSMYAGLVRTSSDKGRWLFIGGNGPSGAPVPLLTEDPSSSRPLTVIAVKAIAENKNIEKVVIVSAIRAMFGIGDIVKNGNYATYDYKYLQRAEAANNYKEVSEEFLRTIEIFVRAGKKVVLVIDNPALPNPEDCVSRKTSIEFINRFLSKENKACYVSLSAFTEQTTKYKSMLEGIRQRFPDAVTIFDPTDIYCDRTNGICGPIHDGRMLYAYTDHISDYAAGLVGEQLNAFLNGR